MAIYHLSAQVISRSAGRSAVAAAAYRSGSCLVEDSTGLTHNFSKKNDVVAKDILAPPDAAPWMRDRRALWNAVETGERRKDAQLAREIRVALPVELTLPQQQSLLRGYLTDQFVSQGMVADYAIHHDNKKNPHAHVMLTMRSIEPGPDGTPRFGKKETAWNARPLLLQWREAWAEASNRSLTLAGHDMRIDHRSYKTQDLRLIPGIKLGVSRKDEAKDQRDIIAERLETQRAIRRQNGEAIARDPTIALEAVTRQQATFTVRSLEAFLRGHTEGREQLRRCMKATLGHGSLVQLGRNGKGGIRLTTREMLAAERQLLATAVALGGSKAGAQPGSGGSPAPETQSVERALGLALSDEQRTALWHLTRPGQRLAVLEGTAGSGKSTLLSAARASLSREGLRVHGAALSGAAAANLEASTGMPSRTLASLERSWSLGRTDGLGKKEVLVVDEAALIGTRQLGRVLERVRAHGGRVVLVGDSAQLPAIEAGAPLRAIGERVGFAELSQVFRQREAWQRTNTEHLARGEVAEALGQYEARGRLQEHEDQRGATQALVAAWQADRTAAPSKSQLMVAYRRSDVAALNLSARACRAEAGELGRERLVATERGLRTFAEQDRVMFLRNNRSLGVSNGTLGTIERLQGSQLQVRLDGPERRQVVVDANVYRDLDHGYASTVHKSQGVTVDRAYVLCSPHFDRHVSYVALSRHREQVTAHWSREAFGDRERLVERLSREGRKDLAVDYLGRQPPGLSDHPCVGQRGPAGPQPSIGQEVAAKEPSPAERLRAARALASGSPLSHEEALKRVPRVQAAEMAWRAAKQEQTALLELKKAYQRAHPVKARFGLAQPLAHLQHSQTAVPVVRAEKLARQQEAAARAALEALRRDPEVTAAAEALRQQDSQARLRARESLPELERTQQQAASDTEKRLAERARVIAEERAQRREKERLAPEIGR